MSKAKIETASTAFDNIAETLVPLATLAVAPENLRAGEGPDEDIPQLAETLYAAGLVNPLLVRPGRKGEAEHMVLDGRRRLLAFSHLADAGRIPGDHPVRVKVLKSRDLQVAAAMLPNTEQLAPDVVDVISAVARLQAQRHSLNDIARALGYPRNQVLRWSALAGLPERSLEALRDRKITLAVAGLMTKLPAEEQERIVDQAYVYGQVYESTVRARIQGARVTVHDPRLRLVGLDAYAAAGGRLESDLFEQTPDLLLDPGVLQALWDGAVAKVVAHLAEQGVAAHICENRWQPLEGLEALYPVHLVELTDAAAAEALQGLMAAEQDAAAALEAQAGSEGGEGSLLAYVDAALARANFGQPSPACAAVISADARLGFALSFHALPPEVTETDLGAATSSADGDDQGPSDAGPEAAPAPPTVAVAESGASTHALNARYTDLATRGLMRTLADHPRAALTLLTARLFCVLTLPGLGDAASSICGVRASAYGPGVEGLMAHLDGEVRARIIERRTDFQASGLRPIAWVAGLDEVARSELLAELVALSLDGREVTLAQRRANARAEAAEIAALTDHQFVDHGPAPLDFYMAHTRAQLLGMLEAMGAEVPQAEDLRKPHLVAAVAEAAAARAWCPPALSWRASEPPAAEANPEADDEPVADAA